MLLWLVDDGQGEEAVRRLPAVEAAHPEPARLLLRVGQALDESREAAAFALVHALAATGQVEEAAALRKKRGLALVMLQRPAEARAELEEARRLDPASASVCLNLAVLEAQEGRLDAARALAREALRLQPDYPQARLLQALERIR